ncbi:MAG: hypothetical protein L0271_11935 [Gemmatimonadetes bacterium]|nr:hypothetical protein [Gemmatimonadota bacterium]
MSLELPRFGLSDCVAAAMCVICAVVTEAVLGRHPTAPGGFGLLAGAVLAAWLYAATLRPARALRRLVWLPDESWRLEYRDGRVTDAHLGAGTRILGRSLVLQWRTAERSLVHWLTPWDVDDGQLRAITVRLACAASLRVS